MINGRWPMTNGRHHHQQDLLLRWWLWSTFTINDNDDSDDDDDRDAKSNLNSTDAKLDPKKLAPNMLFFDIQPSGSF